MAHADARDAEEFCRAKQIKLVDSYDDMLRDPDIDAVVLATPHSQHQAQALAAIAAKKHVFVEKPLTLDLASARAVADAAHKSGLILAVGFTRRFHPSIGELRARVFDGRLGKVIALVAQHTTSTAQFVAPDNWRATAEEAPAGAFTAVGVHALDHMIEFAGRVRDVRCVTARNYPGPSDDTTTIMLRFASGRDRAALLFGRDRDELCLRRLWHQGSRRNHARRPFTFPFHAGLDRGADRIGHRAAGRDSGIFRLRHVARADDGIRALDPRWKFLSGADRRRASRYGGIRRDR